MMLNGLLTTFAEHQDQWHQRWSTYVLREGNVVLKWRDCGELQPWPRLNALDLPAHDFWRLSRIDWFAIRWAGYDEIDLWKLPAVGQVLSKVESTDPAYAIFTDLFREAGGFVLRPCEIAEQQREADDVRSAEMFTPR